MPSKITPALIDLPLAARYGIEAAVWLSQDSGDGYHRVQDIAAKLDLPRDFLAKVFRRLLQAGLLSARRGPGGGYRLAGDPKALRLLDVVEAACAAVPEHRACLLFARQCGTGVCSAHDSVMHAENQLREALGRLTVADLQRDLEPQARLGNGNGNGGGPSVLRMIPLLLALSLAVACRGKEMEVYTVAKQPSDAHMTAGDGHNHDHDHAHEHDAPGSAPARKAAAVPAGGAPSARAPGLQWKAPSGWKSKPAGGMRFATFGVPSEKGEAELSVVVLEGDAGGSLANVNRWRGQLGLGDVDAATFKRDSQEVKSVAGTLLVVDLAGSDGKSGMIGAILPKGDKTWFFKLMGPLQATSAAKPSLVAFLKSLR